MKCKCLLLITLPAVWNFYKRLKGKIVPIHHLPFCNECAISLHNQIVGFMPVSFVLSSQAGLCVPFLSPLKQTSAVSSGFMFPSTLSLHPVTQPSSAPWPEVMATSVDPFPLNDTPPPLPAKKHRRQQQLEQQVTRKVARAWGFYLDNKITDVGSLSFPKLIFLKGKLQSIFFFLIFFLRIFSVS